jgi:hypothetical protein
MPREIYARRHAEFIPSAGRCMRLFIRRLAATAMRHLRLRNACLCRVEFHLHRIMLGDKMVFCDFGQLGQILHGAGIVDEFRLEKRQRRASVERRWQVAMASPSANCARVRFAAGAAACGGLTSLRYRFLMLPMLPENTGTSSALAPFSRHHVQTSRLHFSHFANHASVLACASAMCAGSRRPWPSPG